MSTLSTAPYKGSRDYYPEDKRLQNYIFSTWKRVVEQYGYEEYGVPLIEPIELYAAKSGQELVGEQTYRFKDKGNRDVAIRPEMTPSIARMIAKRRQEMAYPARLYSIANFLRYERPQRGREREFWQLNVDMFGSASPRADAEMLVMASKLMRAFDATDDMYVIRVNSRAVVDLLMHEYLGLDAVQAHLMIKLFDRRDKISNESFRDQAIDVFGVDKAKIGLTKIAALLSANSTDTLPEELRDSDAVTHLRVIIDLAAKVGVKNLRFDATLMRGLDYYTGFVFEVYDTADANGRSMFGGGRYDGLVGLFGDGGISAVGMAPGLSTMELFLETHQLVPSLTSTTELYVVVVDDEHVVEAEYLADRLRKEKVNVEVDFTTRSIDKKVKTAVKKRVPFVIFFGKRELETDTYDLKNTLDASEQKVGFERLVSTVKDRRYHAHDDIDDLFA